MRQNGDWILLFGSVIHIGSAKIVRKRDAAV